MPSTSTRRCGPTTISPDYHRRRPPTDISAPSPTSASTYRPRDRTCKRVGGGAERIQGRLLELRPVRDHRRRTRRLLPRLLRHQAVPQRAQSVGAVPRDRCPRQRRDHERRRSTKRRVCAPSCTKEPAARTTRASRARRWPRRMSRASPLCDRCARRDAEPALVRQIIEQSAADHACPVPATVDYTIVGRPASWNATCTGTPTLNNFYGNGLVDADAAVALASLMGLTTRRPLRPSPLASTRHG